MTQLRLRSSSFHENGSGSCSGAFGFYQCRSGALFFRGSGFDSFSQINIFNCRGVPQVEWKMNYSKPRFIRISAKTDKIGGTNDF